jgi:hypothetical protein
MSDPLGPFRMAVIGDSIAWGQGLNVSSKYHSIVEAWLREQLKPRPVEKQVTAHSGARLFTSRNPEASRPPLERPPREDPDTGPIHPHAAALAELVSPPVNWPTADRPQADPDMAVMQQVSSGDWPTCDPPQADPGWAVMQLNGEIPITWPTVAWQVKHQVRNPETVDLVLLSGGINDIGVFEILNPLRDETWLRAAVQFYLAERLGFVLRNVIIPSFPRASIIITNYFPILSPKSEVVKAEATIRIILPVITALFESLYFIVRNQLPDQCKVFHETSTSSIRGIVKAANSIHNPGIFFAETGFGPDNAIGAPDALLYGPFDQDEVRSTRVTHCDRWRASLPCATARVCDMAHTGHPNARGAQRYADSIMQQLRPLLPKWAPRLTTRALPQPIPIGKKVDVRVEAEDARTEKPVSGQVKIDGQVVASTHTTFSYTFTSTKASCTVTAAGFPVAGVQLGFTSYLQSMTGGIGSDQL